MPDVPVPDVLLLVVVGALVLLLLGRKLARPAPHTTSRGCRAVCPSSHQRSSADGPSGRFGEARAARWPTPRRRALLHHRPTRLGMHLPETCEVRKMQSVRAANDLHSRMRGAGDDPELLFGSIALIVGAGALAQNLAIDLALNGFGEIRIVDFDVFEPHNATRSPLYPSPEEAAHWGMGKATVVAHKLFPMMTAPSPIIRYGVRTIQAIGDAAIVSANVVFAAVDNPSARAFLAERCRLAGRPLIEAGFDGTEVNLAVFGTRADEPCYRCLNPEREGAFSCTRYALRSEEDGVIPAIQNAAAVLAGLQAEQGIQWLHGGAALLSKRLYADVRALNVRVVALATDPACAGLHRSLPHSERLAITADQSVAELLCEVRKSVGPAEFSTPEPVTVRNFCTSCGTLAQVGAAESAWLMAPRCSDCSGPFHPAKDGRYPSSVDWLDTESESELSKQTCRSIGLPPGAALEVHPRVGAPRMLRLDGSVEEAMSNVVSPASDSPLWSWPERAIGVMSRLSTILMHETVRPEYRPSAGSTRFRSGTEPPAIHPGNRRSGSGPGRSSRAPRPTLRAESGVGGPRGRGPSWRRLVAHHVLVECTAADRSDGLEQFRDRQRFLHRRGNRTRP